MTTDRLDIAVRAFTAPKDGGDDESENERGRAGRRRASQSEYTLVFDCETKIDPSQRLRVGSFQVRRASDPEDEPHLVGLFHDPEALDEREKEILAKFIEDRPHLQLLTVREFVDDVFLDFGYELGATIVGFNLPFDLSRLAIGHGWARDNMRGGFSFILSDDVWRPRARVKSINRRAALMDLSAPDDGQLAGSERKRGNRFVKHRGAFLDLKTLAGALLDGSFSLQSLTERLDTPTKKVHVDDHGAPLTADYVEYSLRDVQATWECAQALRALYAQHVLNRPPHKILSAASLGKAYLEKMGAQPFRDVQADFPPERLGQIMCAYYGGRTEVRIRREVREVRYVDFKAMYPTVNALMGLWPFVIASRVAEKDATEATRAFLARVTVADFQKRETWRELTTIVRVRPDADLLPVRAKYDGKGFTIGLNFLTCEQPLWYTLADVVAAKLLSGKTPEILEAIAFIPGQPQEGLQPIELFGDPDFAIDPYKHDVFAELVNLRDKVRRSADERRRKLADAIKILTNAVSYGIYIEIRRDDLPERAPLMVYGPNGEGEEKKLSASEEPGDFFHPIVGVAITGAARLMLALAERAILDQGLEWAFCDTDSMAIAKPEGMERDDFERRVQAVVDWFKPLNPYLADAPILKLEGYNFALDAEGKARGPLAPLYAYAISSKRYALFNLGDAGGVILRKASQHGLGHLLAPYEGEAGDPIEKREGLDVLRWQHDLWVEIIEDGLSGHVKGVRRDWRPEMLHPAAGQYTASTMERWQWFEGWNAGKAYEDQVRPYNFLLSFALKSGVHAEFEEEVVDEPRGPGRPKKERTPRPVAPYSRDTIAAAAKAFDRLTGDPIDVSALKTYADAVQNYHRSPEAKFDNGRASDTGVTQRRHVWAANLIYIGKEANEVEEIDLQEAETLEMPRPVSRSEE